MDLYLIVLRIVHILGATFWVGAATVFALFIEPAAAELGPKGAPFMENLNRKRRLPQVIAVVAGLTIIAGLLLYWRASAGLTGDWITSAPGMAFTIGGLTAIVAYVIGFTVIRPGVEKLGAASAGPAPDPAVLQGLLHRLQTAGRINLVLLLVAVVTMATARYL